MDARCGAERRAAAQRDTARAPGCRVGIRGQSYNSRGARCRRRFSHLVLRRLRGRLLLASSATTHTRARGRDARPSRNRERAGRGRAGGEVGARGAREVGTRAACRAASRLVRRLSRRLTSPLAPTSKSPIMATRPRPPSLLQPRRAARRDRDAGRPLSIVAAAKPRDNFTGTSPPGAYVLAVNRKYDDCHGGPSPTPQELTRAGHCRIDGRGTGPLGGSRPAGGSAVLKKKLCSMFCDEMSHGPFAFLRGNESAGPFSSRRGCARSRRSRARLARFRWREIRAITKARETSLIH